MREVLGETIRTEWNRHLYRINVSPDDPTDVLLIIRFGRDCVEAMTWRYYVD